MTARDAAAFAGVGMGAAKRWSAGRLPRSYTGRPWGSGRIGGDDARTTRGGARVGKIEIKGLHGPPEAGPLAEMTPDQIEKLLLRAVLDDLKEGGSHPLSTPTRSRRGLARGLREATGLPTSTIARFPDIPGGTCCYHLARAVREPGLSPRGAPAAGGAAAPGRRRRRPRTRRCARTAPATSAPRPPTSCGSPTSRSSGCPAGRSAACRPSSTASTAGRRPGRSGRAPRRGSPTPRSRRRARPLYLIASKLRV